MTGASLSPSEATLETPGVARLSRAHPLNARGQRTRSRRQLRLPLAIVLLFVPGLHSCQAGYVIRQGLGQFRLSNEQIPLETITKNDALSAEARAKLAWVPRVLEFAVSRLGLDPGDSYQTYVDTAGEPVSYVVSAAAPLALIPYQWQFPFAGRVGYKGFFDLDEARAEKERLEADGFDTLLTPVQAFSTLGWFRDPILSTMLEKDLPDLVDLLIHESVHRTIYFKAHAAETTAYNESLASHVAYEGTLLFLAAHEDLKQHLVSYRLSKVRARLTGDVIKDLRVDLHTLYSNTLPDDEKRIAKARLFELASRSYKHLTGDSEARLPQTNALILAAAAYKELVPRFRELQKALGGDPKELIAYLKQLPTDELPRLPSGPSTQDRW